MNKRQLKYVYFAVGYLALSAFLAALGYLLYSLLEHSSSIVISLLVFYIINVSFSFALFTQKRHAAAKLSWMMIMFILPIIGHVLFLVFGRRYKYRQSVSEYRQNESFVYDTKRSSDDPYLVTFANLSNRGIYYANTTLYTSGDRGYEALFEDMINAKSTIHVQYYIIKPGEIYERFKSILIAKAAQGVEVKVIVDDFGRWAMPWYEIKELEQKGVKIAIFGRVYFPFINSNNGYRMHRKVAIIDSSIVHTGGVNIANEYASISKDYGVWFDYQVKLVGDVARSFEIIYADDWKLARDEVIDIKPLMKKVSQGKGNSLVTVIETSPKIKEPILQDAIVSMIAKAKKSIQLVTPYLVPTPEIEAALRTAALSGVDVRIYIPGRPDKKSVFVATHQYARTFMEYGVKVYEQSHILLHSKFGVFDGEYAYFGTANIDMRSIYSQYEHIIVGKGQIVKDLSNLINYYEKTAKLLVLKNIEKNYIKAKLSRFYVSLFSPLM